ncbi:MAG TPA: response regulator [Anaeromyxobacteraceae bacterium]|nr:response regulator [Anaeromyxobacteraceae bacterium]
MKRVLIVEDDPALRESMAEILADAGYTVSEAGDGRKGLEEASERRPDLILLDLMMPTMNGWQFRTAQRQLPALADIPVIVMSAWSSEQADAGLEGVAARFPKPFDVSALLDGVRRYAGPAEC